MLAWRVMVYLMQPHFRMHAPPFNSEVFARAPLEAGSQAPETCQLNTAQQDMLSAALDASKTSLSRLIAIQNEVARAIEREKTQIERLTFSVDKAMRDEAYYRSLRRLTEERTKGS